MSITYTNNIQKQIWQNIKNLPLEKQQKVLEFAKSLQQENSIFSQWDNISDTEAKSLQDEFGEEDISFSESILSDYLSYIEKEDRE